MAAFKNPVTDCFQSGRLALGIGVRLARTVEIAKMARACGYDWLFLDLEHGAHSIDAVSQISIAALSVGIAPIVRVPTGQWGMASRVLDGGALGVILPHVENAEDAKAAVRYLKFPPLGHRATLAGLPHYDYVQQDVEVTARDINACTLVIPMIESPTAVENIDAITATPGIDVILVGINDLAAELGAGGDLQHPKVVEAMEIVAAAGRKYGKMVGTGGISSDAILNRYIAMGFHFMLCGNDFSFMMNAARQRADLVRKQQ